MRAMLADDMTAYTRFATEDRRAAVPFFTPEALATNMNVVRLVRQWSDRMGVSPVQFALAWLLAQKPFIVPIPGSTKLHHIRENLGANNVRISAQDLTAFRIQLEALPVVGNRPRSAAGENQ
jgi:aryl-alcohol dehydrogenase-like predicted oxidoreductase